MRGIMDLGIPARNGEAVRVDIDRDDVSGLGKGNGIAADAAAEIGNVRI